MIKEKLKKAQKGDKKAFIELFQQYENDIYRMAYLYVKNKDDALDIVQETAYRAFKNIKNLKGDNFKSWLFRIVINCSIDLFRKNKKIIYLKPEEVEVTAAAEPDILLSITLKELLDTLEEHEKSIVVLKYVHGNTFEEISSIVELPAATVKTKLYRALAKLRTKAERSDMLGR